LINWELVAGRGSEAIRIAQAAVRQAEAQRDRALGAQKAQGIGQEILQVQISEAQGYLAQAIAAQEAYTITLDMLAVGVEAARLELDALRAWENPYLDPASLEEIAQARARLRQAELSVAQLELQLQSTELRAPFDGVISALEVRRAWKDNNHEWITPKTMLEGNPRRCEQHYSAMGRYRSMTNSIPGKSIGTLHWGIRTLFSSHWWAAHLYLLSSRHVTSFFQVAPITSYCPFGTSHLVTA